MESYVQLNTHSHYSFLRALPKIPDLVAQAKKYGSKALALTDAGNLHGAIEFYKECTKNNIKPIIGVHTYLAPESYQKEHGRDTALTRIILLAKNEVGYKNLLALVTTSHLEGFCERPRVDRELLKQHSNGLIAILPAHKSELAPLLQQKDTESAAALLSEYKTIFPDALYVEITHHPELKGHTQYIAQLALLAKQVAVPLVAQQEVYYLNKEDSEAREVLMRIREGRQLESETSTMDLSFREPKQLVNAFKEYPEAIQNSQNIADQISLTFDLGKWVFPKIGNDTDDHQQILTNLAYEGIQKRGLSKTQEVVERIEYELSIIKAKGFAPYFLVVGDLLQFARENNILTNIRGSVAGSLVTYLIGITNVNPLEYKLPFERFLNPERPSAPDIDMDFADNRRDEVINYARRKYGNDHVAQIGTFGTMAARAAVRDTARAMGHPYMTGDRIAKLIPIGSQGFPMTIERALELEPDLKKLYKTDEDAREIIDLAQKIEGCARHTGVHAAGVVISPTPLIEWTPLQKDPKGGKIITQYDMHSVEDAGLLKFDFLGIKNLSILADAVERTEKEIGVTVDIEHIPLDDAKTFTLLAQGETEGTFQLNGSGMTHFLKELKPTTIHDINAMVALYRPGPMESIPSYIERKHNPELITYPDDRMKDILSQSYGVITYQDDVLLTAIHLAGYSWLEADKLRKAMGKKIPKEMEAQKEKFISGCIKGGMDTKKAEHIWDLISPFAGYGFNKAHAASYGRVAYQTAYMKANFPVPYMAALLAADAGDVEKINTLVNECERMGIPVLPPDINESDTNFTIVEQGTKIRFGLVSIKNFGAGVGEKIMEERTQNGPFITLTDFLLRMPKGSINKKALEALIQTGALDTLGERKQMLKNIETLLSFHKEAHSETETQEGLFGALPVSHTLTLSETKPATLGEKLAWEKELLGIYISGHPLDVHKQKIKEMRQNIKGLTQNPRAGFPVRVICMVDEVRQILTKKGDKMAFVRFVDLSGSLEGVLFPEPFTKHKELLVPGTCIHLKGSISRRNDETSVIVEEMKAL